MAVALGKKCNAATVRFRARPSGPTGCSALRVASFRQADACLQNGALIAKQPVGQRPYAINQRCLYIHKIFHLIAIHELFLFLCRAARKSDRNVSHHGFGRFGDFVRCESRALQKTSFVEL
jgi:hypothetical protein